MPKLVTFSENWADEFQAEGFRLFADDEWIKFKEHAEVAEQFYFMFGTNEGWEDGYIEPEDIITGMQVEDVTEEEAVVLRKFFPSNNFGIFPDEECFSDGEEWA